MQPYRRQRLQKHRSGNQYAVAKDVERRSSSGEIGPNPDIVRRVCHARTQVPCNDAQRGVAPVVRSRSAATLRRAAHRGGAGAGSGRARRAMSGRGDGEVDHGKAGAGLLQ